MGVGAGELLPVVQFAIKRRLPYTDIAEIVITHPTLDEGCSRQYLHEVEMGRGNSNGWEHPDKHENECSCTSTKPISFSYSQSSYIKLEHRKNSSG